MKRISDQSLFDHEKCDYALEEIEQMLIGGENRDAMMVSDLTDKQARAALNIYIKEYNKLKKKIRRAVETVENLEKTK